MHLRVFTSQRLERLADRLAAGFARDPLPPLAPEFVVVQSPGMRRYLTLGLADRLGVAANLRFLFPNECVDLLFDRVLGAAGDDPFAPAELSFRLLAELPALLPRPAFADVRTYLADGDARKARRFTRALADLFDKHFIHRADRILAWAAGETPDDPDERWQAELFRAVRDALPPARRDRHRAARFAAYRDRLAAGDVDPAALPARLSVFGVTTLPPFHLDCLRLAGALRPAALYLLEPCAQYWGDLRTARENLARAAREGKSPDELYLAEGHPLLASFGRLGREFHDLRVELGLDETSLDPEDDAGRAGSLLERLQAALRDLRDGPDPAAPPVDPGDRSIRLHACHGPRREVETLHDALLDLFDRDPTLMPRDVIVMAPDIETYAPYIEALFGLPEPPAPRIPHTVADRKLARTNAWVAAFLALLEAPEGRASLPETLALLDAAPVRARFELSENDLARLAARFEEARIRFGRDAGWRRDRGFPATAAHTWQAGYERLLLGFAAPLDGERLYRGILPVDDVEVGDAEILGRAARLLDLLFRFAADAKRPRPARAWAETLAALADAALLAEGDAEEGRERVLAALADFAGTAERAGYGDDLPYDVVREEIASTLEAADRGRGFLAGGVTFCSMLPMRSVPARVVCLLGLDDGAFPRSAEPAGYDWSARRRRPGDRSRRDDDRYLFLEAILSARERLLLSCTGQSARDNKPLPPSTVVSELLDALDRAHPAGPGGEPPSARLVRRLPLQPFSPSLFSGAPAGRSRSRAMRRAAEALVAGRAAPAGRLFFPGPLPEPPPELLAPTLEDLLEFFRAPAKFLLRRRLGLALPAESPAPAEDEPFALDGRERYRLRAELLERPLDDRAAHAAWRAAVRAGGRLPEGEVGDRLLDVEVEAMREFRAEWERAGGGAAAEPPEPFSCEASGVALSGALDRLRAGARLVAHPHALKGMPLARAWIGHLALGLAAGRPRETRLVGFVTRTVKGRKVPRPKTLRFAPLPRGEARERLAALLCFYRDGLRLPCPSFPESALAYVKALRKGGSAGEARDAARELFTGSDFSRGEGEDPWVRLAFAGRDALADPFPALAGALLDAASAAEEGA